MALRSLASTGRPSQCASLRRTGAAPPHDGASVGQQAASAPDLLLDCAAGLYGAPTAAATGRAHNARAASPLPPSPPPRAALPLRARVSFAAELRVQLWRFCLQRWRARAIFALACAASSTGALALGLLALAGGQVSGFSGALRDAASCGTAQRVVHLFSTLMTALGFGLPAALAVAQQAALLRKEALSGVRVGPALFARFIGEIPWLLLQALAFAVPLKDVARLATPLPSLLLATAAHGFACAGLGALCASALGANVELVAALLVMLLGGRACGERRLGTSSAPMQPGRPAALLGAGLLSPLHRATARLGYPCGRWPRGWRHGAQVLRRSTPRRAAQRRHDRAARRAAAARARVVAVACAGTLDQRAPPGP